MGADALDEVGPYEFGPCLELALAILSEDEALHRGVCIGGAFMLQEMQEAAAGEPALRDASYRVDAELSEE